MTRRESDASEALIIVFSRAGENYWEGGRRDLTIGNTARLAALLARRLGCPIHEIRPADPYPDSYDATVARNAAERDQDLRPAIVGELPDITGHDTILLGCPVWESRPPMIMWTLIESLDLSGKRLLPFVTHAVSGMVGIDDTYRRELAGTDVSIGLAVRGEDVDLALPEAENWLRDTHLIE